MFRITWTPIALIGMAVAFIIGFQNNAVYGRIWEEGKIWGIIVNTYRTFGVFAKDMLSDEHTKENISKEIIQEEIRILTYWRIAWMTTLRYAMQNKKQWETTSKHKTDTECVILPPEQNSSLQEELKAYLSADDLEEAMSTVNHQTAILHLQLHHVRRLKDEGIIWEFSFLELETLIKELFVPRSKQSASRIFHTPDNMLR